MVWTGRKGRRKRSSGVRARRVRCGSERGIRPCNHDTQPTFEKKGILNGGAPSANDLFVLFVEDSVLSTKISDPDLMHVHLHINGPDQIFPNIPSLFSLNEYSIS